MPKYVRDRYYNLNRAFEDAGGNKYGQAAADKLVLWTRFYGSPKDASPHDLTLSYNNSPTINEALLGKRIYSAATFTDAANTHAEISSSPSDLSFSIIGDGGTPRAGGDRPFSISFWIKIDTLGANNYLFTKSSVSHAKYEYTSYTDSSGRLIFGLQDTSGSTAAETIWAATGKFAADNIWRHVVLTYDGSGGGSARNGMEMYVDGENATDNRTSVGSYTGMVPDYGEEFYIAADKDGANEFDGSMAEFAVWSKELTANEVTAIYNVTRNSLTISGYLNNPPRILLQQQDNATGSYPTVARTGDPDFLGTGKVHFNDMKSVVFFSSYAAGEIELKHMPRRDDTISLTGSDGTTKNLFEFQRGTTRKYQAGKYPGYEAQDSQAVIDLGGNNRSPRTVAHGLAMAINSSSLGIHATTLGSTVKLRHHVPVTGTFKQGNLINFL